MTAASTLDIIFAVVLTTALLLFVMIASEGIARGDKDILETSDGPRGKAAKRPDGEGLEELQTRGETRDGQATPKIGETSQRDVEVGLEPIDVDRIEKVYKYVPLILKNRPSVRGVFFSNYFCRKLDRRILPGAFRQNLCF